jgi:hypothetical protein
MRLRTFHIFWHLVGKLMLSVAYFSMSILAY